MRFGGRRKVWGTGGALLLWLAVAAPVPARPHAGLPVPLPSIAIPVQAPRAAGRPGKDLRVKLNVERVAAGLLPLATQPWAQSVAMAHSEDMAAVRSLWHINTGYLDIAKQAITASLSGDNVAEAGTLDEADALLTASRPGLANILYPRSTLWGSEWPWTSPVTCMSPRTS